MEIWSVSGRDWVKAPFRDFPGPSENLEQILLSYVESTIATHGSRWARGGITSEECRFDDVFVVFDRAEVEKFGSFFAGVLSDHDLVDVLNGLYIREFGGPLHRLLQEHRSPYWGKLQPFRYVSAQGPLVDAWGGNSVGDAYVAFAVNPHTASMTHPYWKDWQLRYLEPHETSSPPLPSAV